MTRVPNVLRQHISGVTLILTLVLAALLRFPTLGTQSLWTDEGNTVAWLHGSFGHMLSAVANNESSPPLYFCVAWLWAKIFGDWIVALRALSAVLGCATVAVAFCGAKRLYGMRVAAILGLLVATSATFIWYSQEARQYALLVLLCTLSLILWARVVVLREDRPVVWWAVVSGLALATHYFAAFIVLPEAAVLLVRAPRTRNSIVAAATLAAFVAAIIPFALYQRSTTNISWIAGAGSLLSRLRSTEGFLLVNGGAGIPHAWWLGRLFVVAALALVLWRGTAGERRTAASLAALAAAVVALAVLAALAGFDYVLPRHLLVVYVPLVAAIAIALGSARAGSLGLLVAVAGAALGVAVTLSINGNIAYQREDVRDVARALGAPSPDRVVILQRPADYLLQDGGAPTFQYYAASLRYMPGGADTVDEIDVIDEDVPPAYVRTTLSRLTHLGFHLSRHQRRQKFVTYGLVAPQAIVLTRDALLRAARFAGADPLLLVQ
jgi:mannosyltransferase